ncbi:MAG: hypothetical protein AB9828_05995 [Sphaerochaetaceae bacterium]
MDSIGVVPRMRQHSWGSTYSIPCLRGVDIPGDPVGELCMGAQGGAPSIVSAYGYAW